MTKIIVNGRKFSVKVSSVLGFCTSASVRIGSVRFEGRDCPYGFTAAALDDLLAKVQKRYPAAAFA